MAAKTMHHSYK